MKIVISKNNISCRVLRPPGGGSSIFIGDPEPPKPKPAVETKERPSAPQIKNDPQTVNSVQARKPPGGASSIRLG